jgi:hypothetical protein
MTNASISPGSVDFGEVEVGSRITRTLRITNTNMVPIDIVLYVVGGECGFFTHQRSLSLEPGRSGDIQVSFAPREPNRCFASLIVEIARSQERVPLMGIGILPRPVNIMIGGVDTGIIDTRYEGQFISEWIEQCAREAKNHGKFVSCVAHLTNDLKREGIITEKEKGIIQRCAAQTK